MSQQPNMPHLILDETAANTLTLAAEEVTVERRRIAGDLVRLSTSTQTREVEVDEEFTHEHVTVEHVPIGQAIDAVPDIRVEGDVTIIPVVREEIVIQRRLVLVEEVHMRRVQVTGRHRETVTLREQVAAVTRIGTGPGRDANSPTAAMPVIQPIKEASS